MALIRSSLRTLARCLLGLACIAAATLSPFAQAQPPARAPFPWIDIHLHLIGGPGVGFAERNAPKFQATIHFLSLLAPEIGAKAGRENAMRLFKLAK